MKKGTEMITWCYLAEIVHRLASPGHSAAVFTGERKGDSAVEKGRVRRSAAERGGAARVLEKPERGVPAATKPATHAPGQH